VAFTQPGNTRYGFSKRVTGLREKGLDGATGQPVALVRSDPRSPLATPGGYFFTHAKDNVGSWGCMAECSRRRIGDTVAGMLIDSVVPRYDFRESHQMVILASRQVVRRALEEWQPQESFLWRVLLRVRGLGRPHGTLREWAESRGFTCLVDTEDEMVYGQAGRFWNVGERRPSISPRSAEEFRSFDRPNYAIAAMNVHIESLGPGITGLSTETRIRAIGARARWLFRFYWLLIRPFSGLLRQSMLRGIRKRALLLSQTHAMEE
jgi:hypothetical protein